MIRSKALLILFILICRATVFGQFTISEGEKSIQLLIEHSKNESELNAANYFSQYVKEVCRYDLTIATKKGKSKKYISIGSDETLHPDGFTITVTPQFVVIKGGNRKGCTYAVIELFKRYAGCQYYSPDTRIFPSTGKLQFNNGFIKDQPAFDNRIINVYFNHTPEFIDWNRLQTIDELYPSGYFVHTFTKLAPQKTEFRTYTDCFALINGERSKSQLCPSHPETVEQIALHLKKEMKKQPTKNVWSVSQNDNEFYCQCELCNKVIQQEGSPAGPIIRLVNQLAEQFPDKTISTLAYQYSRKPTQTKPLKNVEIMLCTIEMMRERSIKESQDQQFIEDLTGWKKFQSNLFLWDYTINFDHPLAPFPNLHTLQANVQLFKENGVKSLFEQSNSTHGYEFSELKLFLLSELMWNPDTDLNKATDDFLKAYYGAGAPAIKAYSNFLFKELTRTKTNLWIYDSPTVHKNDMFSEKNIQSLSNYLLEAKSVVKNDPVAFKHIEQLELGILYTQLEIAIDQPIGARGFYNKIGDDYVQTENSINTLRAFKRITDEQKIMSVNEKNLTPQQYIAGIERILDKQFKNNKAVSAQLTTVDLPSKKYGQGNLQTLQDGLKSSFDFKKNWLGWEGSNATLEFDLKSSQEIHSLQTSFLFKPESWILFPNSIEISFSTDGKNWERVEDAHVTWEKSVDNQVSNVEVTFNKVTARYIKVHVNGTLVLPEDHLFKGNKSWFFMDEISIF